MQRVVALHALRRSGGEGSRERYAEGAELRTRLGEGAQAVLGHGSNRRRRHAGVDGRLAQFVPEAVQRRSGIKSAARRGQRVADRQERTERC